MTLRNALSKLVLGCVLALAGPTQGGADDLRIPELTGRVVDQAKILSADTEAEISAKSRTFETNTTAQLVVVTLRSLQGRTIEDWGLILGQIWGIGQKDRDNGVLLLVAPRERELRIEVGIGLEHVLTDEKAASIVHNVIVPRFKAGNLDNGILAGMDAIIGVVTGNEVAEMRGISAAGILATISAYQQWIPWIVVGIFLIVVLVTKTVRHRIVIGPSDDEYYDDEPQHFSSNRRERDRESRSWIGGSSGGSGGGFGGGGGSFGGGGASGKW